MPTISTFYGIIIRMFFDEHAPPHFHTQTGIRACAGLGGIASSELLQDWDLCQQHQQPMKIEPIR